jgi:hypothetical protein
VEDEDDEERGWGRSRPVQIRRGGGSTGMKGLVVGDCVKGWWDVRGNR